MFFLTTASFYLAQQQLLNPNAKVYLNCASTKFAKFNVATDGGGVYGGAGLLFKLNAIRPRNLELETCFQILVPGSCFMVQGSWFLFLYSKFQVSRFKVYGFLVTGFLFLFLGFGFMVLGSCLRLLDPGDQLLVPGSR